MSRDDSPRNTMTTKDIILMTLESGLFLAQVVVCILTYNRLGLTLVAIAGWVLLLVASLLGWQARVAFEEKGEQHQDESWLHTRTVVDSGVYGIVRHPMYLSFALIALTLVCLSQHWLNALLGTILIGLLYNDMCREERGNVAKFGDAYREYMARVDATIDERVGDMLKRLRIPSQQDLAELKTRLDALSSRLDQLAQHVEDREKSSAEA